MGYISPWLIEWRSILNEGVDAIVAVYEGIDEHSAVLRKNSPFSGILTEDERLDVIFDDEGTRARSFCVPSPKSSSAVFLNLIKTFLE